MEIKISKIKKINIDLYMVNGEEKMSLKFDIAMDDWVLIQRLRDMSKIKLADNITDLDFLENIQGIFAAMAPGMWEDLLAFCGGSITAVSKAVMDIGVVVMQKIGEARASDFAPSAKQVNDL